MMVGYLAGVLLAAVGILSTTAEGRLLQKGSYTRRQANNVTQTEYPGYIYAVSTDNSPVALEINLDDTSARNKTAPYLYGLMFEDINHSGDGGIYAELITNRAFQGSNVQTGTYDGMSGSVIVDSENEVVPWGPVLTGWDTIGEGTRMLLDVLHPLSEALPVVMELDIPPSNGSMEVGFKNYGWWGMDVSPQTYTVSFYALANAPRSKSGFDLTLSLRSNLTDETFCSTTLRNVTFPNVHWRQYHATIDCNATAPSSNNTFAVTMDAEEVGDSTYYFNLISVFPETFKGRKNGLRKDIAQAFYDMKPRFLRFPGGNNLEGVSFFTRWRWWKTIGPLKDRPGRPGDWSYYNTDGLGLLEYLEWTEDMEIEPILDVYAGFSLDVFGQSGTSFPEDDMDLIVQEALDELEYCMGDESTKYGRLRAEHGHPEPFNIKFVEIGNEDWFSITYPYRWRAMYDGLKAKYPNITYISSTYNEASADYIIDLPGGSIWDTHHYEEPSYFLENFDFYDNWQQSTDNPDVGVFLGEYSVIQVDTPSGVVDFTFPEDVHVFHPQLLSAIAEGVYALGGERNPDVVRMSAYAPSLMNRNWYNWTPDMISFNADPNQTVLSASYWQQWLFAHHRGTETLPVSSTTGHLNPLYWAGSIDGDDTVYLKVINAGNSSVPLSVNLGHTWKSANGTILTGPSLHAYNTVENMGNVVPRKLNLTSDMAGNGSNGNFSWEVPRFSLAVLQFDL